MTPGLWSRVVGWLATIAIVALAVGIVRSLVRFVGGTLPDQYLIHGIIANGGLFLAIGVALSPWVVFAGRRGSQEGGGSSTWRTRALLVSGVALVFWGLNTAIGFRVLGELLHGEVEPVRSELFLWVPGMLGAVALGSWLARGSCLFEVGRRHATSSLVLVVVALSAMAYSRAKDPSSSDSLDLQPSARRHHPIVLILIDTLRADHLSCYGYDRPTSPHLDELAREGVLYGRAFAPAPWTRPSCGALMSSRYPPEIGLDRIYSALPEDVPILPQFLRREGYRTGGIAASVQVSAQFGFAKGYDSYDIGSTYLQWTGIKMALSRLGLVSFGDIYPRYDAEELTDRAVDWIERQGDGVPFFIYLHYADPHAPYLPPAEADRWRELATPAALEVAEPPLTPTWLGRDLTRAEGEAMVARYDAEIAFLDAEIARLFDFLKERGLWHETLVIVTADHGEEFQDHGGWLHASSLYNEQIHVPLIVKYPTSLAYGAGRRVDHEASLVDIVPTIRDVLDADWPISFFRGRSLVRREMGSDDYAVYSRAFDQRLRALMRGGDKIIQRVGASREEVEEETYFSLNDDFRELAEGRSVGSVDPDRLEQMRSILEGIDSRQTGGSEEITLDEETRRELEALGYLH